MKHRRAALLALWIIIATPMLCAYAVDYMYYWIK